MYWNWSDWAFNQTSWTANLALNTVHQFTSFNLSLWATLTTTDTEWAVMYILCTWDVTIAWDVLLNNKVNPWDREDTFSWDWNDIDSPWVAKWWKWANVWTQIESVSWNWQWAFWWNESVQFTINECKSVDSSYPFQVWPKWEWWTVTSPSSQFYYYNWTEAWDHIQWENSTWAGWSAVTANWTATSWDWWSSFWDNGQNYQVCTKNSWWVSFSFWWGWGWWESWKPWITFIIKARSITFTGVINTSATNWQKWWDWWQSASNASAYPNWYTLYKSWGWGWGWGWKAWDINFHYSVSLTDSWTKTMTAWIWWAIWAYWSTTNLGTTQTWTQWWNAPSAWTNWATGSFSSAFEWFTNAINAYSSDDSYATVLADNWNIVVSLSKDSWNNFHNEISKTYTGTEWLQAYWSSTEVWGTTWIWTDVNSVFRLKIVCWWSTVYKQVYWWFWFSIAGSNTLTWIEVSVEAKWNWTTTSIDHIKVKVYYWTSLIPIEAWSQAYASDWRKAWEWVWVWTWVLTFYDWTNWIAVDSGLTVTA